MDFIKGFYLFVFVLFLCLLIFHLLTRKFLNPFKLLIYIGKKGSGKTTFAVSQIYKYLKKHGIVYANVDVPGVRYFDPKLLGKFTFEPGSLVVIDEVNMYWDNRSWKQTCVETLEYLRYQRQYRVTIMMFSQTYDVDPKIRSLADSLYLVYNKARVFAWYKRILKWPDLQQADGPTDARVVDKIKFDSLLFWPFGSRHLLYIPKWAKYFKSYNPPALDLMPYEYRFDILRAPKFFRKKKWQRYLPTGDHYGPDGQWSVSRDFPNNKAT